MIIATMRQCVDQIVSVDVGASKVAAGVADQACAREVARFQTPRHNLDKFVSCLGTVILGITREYGTRAVSVGYNGPAGVEGDPRLVGPLYHITDDVVDMGDRIQHKFPELAGIRLLNLNDAEMAAYEAKRYAVGRGLMWYVNQGTGIGGEVIYPTGSSMRKLGHLSEYGEMIFRRPDGSRATWGSLVSGEGIEERYGTPTLPTARELGQTYTSYTDEVWQQVACDLADGFCAYACASGPTDIVMGGSVTRQRHRYERTLRRELATNFSVLSSDSATKCPNITFVPESALDTLALRGGYTAMQQRMDDAVLLGSS